LEIRDCIYEFSHSNMSLDLHLQKISIVHFLKLHLRIKHIVYSMLLKTKVENRVLGKLGCVWIEGL